MLKNGQINRNELLYAEERTDIQAPVAVCLRTDRQSDTCFSMLKKGQTDRHELLYAEERTDIQVRVALS
jgi:hypothetical protein